MVKHADQVGRILGMSVFVAGIILLATIFVVTFRMFTHSFPELAAIIHSATQPLKPGQPAPGSALPAILAAVLAIFCKIGLLLLGVIVGSIISSQGIRLYFTSAGSGHAVVPGPPSLTISEAPVKIDPPASKSARNQ